MYSVMKRAHDEDENGPTRPVQSGVFQLQCHDAYSERLADESLRLKWSKIAAKLAHTLSKSKGKHTGEYNDVSFVSNAMLGVSFPFDTSFLQYTESEEGTYKWIPPSVKTVSIHSPKLSEADGYFVDIHLTLPMALLGQRDYINLVYATKRALYLCSCASFIKTEYKNLSIEWSIGDQGVHFPHLLITKPDQKGGIRVHCTANMEGWLKMHRFRPAMGNLRPSIFMNGVKELDRSATPRYNQRLLSHFLAHPLAVHFENEFNEHEQFLTAFTLIKQWHEARPVHGWTALLTSLFFSHLCHCNDVSSVQDITTILKLYFNFLVSWDVSAPLHIKRGVEHDEVPDRVLPEIVSAFEVVVMDGGWFNAASELTKQTVKKIKDDALLTIENIGNSASFDDLFMDKFCFEDCYDYYIGLSVPISTLSAPAYSADVECFSDRLHLFAKNTLSLFEKAMPERYTYAGVKCVIEVNHKWDVSSKPAMSTPSSKSLCLLLSFRASNEWSNPLTIGPVANLPEAAEFRKFWNNQTQLRRFGDNKITETMVWDDKANVAIAARIAVFLASQKLSLREEDVTFRSHLMRFLLRNTPAFETTSLAFAKLSGMLRNLKNLPLSVTNILGTSSYLRGTEPNETFVRFPVVSGALDYDLKVMLPTPEDIPIYTPSVELLVKLEYSIKWGNEVEVIRRLIQAFYVQLGDELVNQHPKEVMCYPSPGALYVILKRICFRIVIVNDKIIAILRRDVDQMRNEGVEDVDKRPQAKRLKMLSRVFIAEPSIKNSLYSISKKYPFFMDSCQLFKQWLAAKHLSTCLHELVVEMLVTAAFETPRTLGSPTSALAGFRRVLRLIVTHNWVMRPLIVDLDGKWSESDREQIETQFIKMRPVLPPMVICNQEDMVGSSWTSENPTPVLLKRLVALARESLNAVNKALTGPTNIDLTNLFHSASNISYDATIHLHPEFNPRKPRGRPHKETFALPVVDFNCIEPFVERLNNEFHNVAMFFFDKYCGFRIQLKWKENMNVHDAKISRCGSYRLLDNEKMEINKDEVYEGIFLLGEGMVHHIKENTTAVAGLKSQKQLKEYNHNEERVRKLILEEPEEVIEDVDNEDDLDGIDGEDNEMECGSDESGDDGEGQDSDEDEDEDDEDEDEDEEDETFEMDTSGLDDKEVDMAQALMKLMGKGKGKLVDGNEDDSDEEEIEDEYEGDEEEEEEEGENSSVASEDEPENMNGESPMKNVIIDDMSSDDDDFEDEDEEESEEEEEIVASVPKKRPLNVVNGLGKKKQLKKQDIVLHKKPTLPISSGIKAKKVTTPAPKPVENKKQKTLSGKVSKRSRKRTGGTNKFK